MVHRNPDIVLRLYDPLRCCGGAVFLLSGISKFWDLSNFIEIISRNGAVPVGMAPYLATGICILEIMFGTFLIADLWPVVSSVMLLLMTASLTIWSFSNWLLGNISDCGCFGKLMQRQNDMWLVAENSLICILLVGTIVVQHRRKNVGRG